MSSDRFVPVPPTARTSEVTLLELHTAITIGAQVARIAAWVWGLPHLEPAAEQTAEHLIARAVEITGHPDPNPRPSDIDPAALAAVSIRVHRRADALIIDVWDTDPTSPDTTPPDPHMSTVDTLARRWGTYPVPRGGKVIWAEIGPTPDNHSSAGLTQPDATDHATPHPNPRADACLYPAA
ncbi:hypothetical protein [Streptosporangium subroseum]|uniref:hypothetical protein n=1 Tax=Streptosporangium subroseum TaxID=106412 RepID=UPI0030870504|nr:hypothetical protein OHB15_18625 [Streptosporangium subroseum]